MSKRLGFLMPAATVIAGSLFASTLVFAGPPDHVDNQADVNHPDIHDNVGDGSNANPNGANDGGGNLHGIGNNPGQSASNPNDDGTQGFANELESVHGGIGDVNKNAD